MDVAFIGSFSFYQKLGIPSLATQRGSEQQHNWCSTGMYHKKLTTQFRTISLCDGLKSLPPQCGFSLGQARRPCCCHTSPQIVTQKDLIVFVNLMALLPIVCVDAGVREKQG
jgi:hypothetical protein